MIEVETFQVQQIWRQQAQERLDVSHLIDRTYRYHSVRELRWHLADRFSGPVHSLSLSRV
ncbi:hypothetical protein [Methylobacterium sp. 4-46]|uniref:hypothetical protein n=1 Tax=unclassified Methylobacterium TaxID=2615210 RepID=UPI0002F16B30